MEDNKEKGFRVRFTQADPSKGWDEADVDLSCLRRTSIAEEFTSIGVARNLICEVDLAVSATDMTNQEAAAPGEEGHEVEPPTFTEAETTNWEEL